MSGINARQSILIPSLRLLIIIIKSETEAYFVTPNQNEFKRNVLIMISLSQRNLYLVRRWYIKLTINNMKEDAGFFDMILSALSISPIIHHYLLHNFFTKTKMQNPVPLLKSRFMKDFHNCEISQHLRITSKFDRTYFLNFSWSPLLIGLNTTRT